MGHEKLHVQEEHHCRIQRSSVNSFHQIRKDVPARVVDDFLDNAANVAVPLGEVEGT